MTDLIINFIDKLFTEKNPPEVNSKDFFNDLNLSQKIKIFSPALGCTLSSNEQHRFGWTHPLWRYLQGSQFSFNSTDQMRLDLKQPLCELTSSWTYGSKGKKDGLFPSEFRQLALIRDANLSIDESKTRWENEVVFTPFSTSVLFKMHLHLNDAMIKKMIKSRNNYCFFIEMSKSGDLSDLPVELIRIICTMAWFGLLLSPRELNSERHVADISSKPLDLLPLSGPIF